MGFLFNKQAKKSSISNRKDRTKKHAVHKKVSARGATKTISRSKPQRKYGLWLLFGVLVCASAYAAANVGWGLEFKSEFEDQPKSGLKNDFKAGLDSYAKKFSAVANKPIRNIVIQGEFSRVSQEDIQSVVEKNISDDFMNTDLNAVKALVESHPWVFGSSVRRQWPDNLVIVIEEQLPIARWGKKGFINRYGELIKVKKNDNLNYLPMLISAEKYNDGFAHKYLEVSKMLSLYKLALKSLKLSDTKVYELELQQGMKLIVNEFDLIAKLQVFGKLYQSRLVDDERNIIKADLRYEGGIAIEWSKPMKLVINDF